MIAVARDAGLLHEWQFNAGHWNAKYWCTALKINFYEYISFTLFFFCGYACD